MSGLNTGRCGFSGCENPVPRDEDFCCAGCEEAALREDEEVALAEWFGGYGFNADNPPLTVEQMHREAGAYPRTEWDEDAGVWVEWESEGVGRVVGPPEDAVQRRVEPGF